MVSQKPGIYSSSSNSSSEASSLSVQSEHSPLTSGVKRASSTDHDPVSHKKRKISEPHQSADYGDSSSNSADASPVKTGTIAKTTEGKSPYTAGFFREMANTIKKVFPVSTFADEHHCGRNDVTQAIDKLIVGLLAVPKFMESTPESRGDFAVKTYETIKSGRCNGVGKKPAKGSCVTRASRSVIPVERRRVWRDEYGNYVSVDEDDEDEDEDEAEERRRIYRRRRQRRLLGDFRVSLIDDE